jgi:hypothetical protein
MYRFGTHFFAATLLLLPGFVLPGAAVAQAGEGLVGTWKLVAFKIWPSDTKEEARDALGPNPQGRLILTPTGYITSFRVAEGRKPAQTDAERAQLLRTMAAWTGRYRVEGNSLLVKIDASWNENDTGQEYLRTFVLDGNRLTITTVTPSSNFVPGRPASGNEFFERED